MKTGYKTDDAEVNSRQPALLKLRPKAQYKVIIIIIIIIIFALGSIDPWL